MKLLATLKEFSQSAVLSYARTRTPMQYLGAMLFPQKPISGLDFKYIVGANRKPVMATIHSFNSEAQIASRDGLNAVKGNIALIKRKINVDEETIIRLATPRQGTNEQEEAIQDIFNDADNMIEAVLARIEYMRMEAIHSGKIEVDENGIQATVDFGVSTDQQETLEGTSLWSDYDDAAPLDDMQEWSDTVEEISGIKPPRSLTSNVVLSHLLRCEQIRKAIYGDNGGSQVITKAQLNTLLQSMDLPIIDTNNEKARIQAADGTISTVRFFPAHKFVMLPGQELGETLYGPTAESIANKVKVSDNNIFVQVYETDDPVQIWTKAVATAFPTFPMADAIFQAEVIAEQ